MKVCEGCVESSGDRTGLAERGREHVHMNEWEHMSRPAELRGFELRGSQALDRIFELPQDVHQRIMDALRLLSLRPYFSRLWVCRTISAQVETPR